MNVNGSRWILRQPLSRESESHNSFQNPPVERTADWKRVRLRYVLRYAGYRGSTCLQGLRVPPGSCKLLKCLMLGMAWKRSSVRSRSGPPKTSLLTDICRRRRDAVPCLDGAEGCWSFCTSSGSINLTTFRLASRFCCETARE